VFFLKFL